MARADTELDWWKKGVVYQVYPRSFMDSDGDGIGDLAGIESRLHHFTELGIDAIWISPIYPSPMADFGYDITDYCDIDPIFGTLADFDRLLAAAHGCGLRVLMDFVPSHTSDRHPWFTESRAARTRRNLSAEPDSRRVPTMAAMQSSTKSAPTSCAAEASAAR